LPRGQDPAAILPKVKQVADPVALDALLAPLAEALPFQREAVHYEAIARLLEAAGKPQLAGAWRRRAEVVEGSFVNDPARIEIAMDRLARVTVGIFWGLVLLALAIGLGVGAARDPKRAPSGPLVLHVVALLTLAFCAVLATGSLAGPVNTHEKHASAPLGLFMDRWGQPEVKNWIARRVREPARGPMLAYAEAEARVAPGTHSGGTPPTDGTIRQGLSPTQGFFDRMPSAAGGMHLSEVLPPAFAPLTLPVDDLLRTLLAAAIALILGIIIGRAAPASSVLAQWVVPGASRWLAPLGGLACAATLTGLFNLRSGSWAIAVLLAGLVLHGLGTLADHRLGR
jgi:hypothetical protein